MKKRNKKEKKYTYKYFKENIPKWKLDKEILISKKFYRPISYYVSSFFSNRGITANTVSYISIIVSIFSCILFMIPNYCCNIIGAVLIHVWYILDCVDGNIARAVKKQPFGEFADACSSYILVGFLCTAMGISAYFTGGVLFKTGSISMIIVGAIASSSDTMMRLIYQKYKNSENELCEKGVLKKEVDKRNDTSKVKSLPVIIEQRFGIGGILPLIILLGVIFKFMDLVVIYCFLYYFLSSIAMIFKYIFKAIKTTKNIEEKTE